MGILGVFHTVQKVFWNKENPVILDLTCCNKQVLHFVAVVHCGLVITKHQRWKKLKLTQTSASEELPSIAGNNVSRSGGYFVPCDLTKVGLVMFTN